MVKVYKSGKIVLESPPEGWAILWFVDGYKAQVAGARIIVKDAKELVEFYLSPYEATAKRFKIDTKNDLDKSGYCYKYYPKDMVLPLNTYDPARRIFFCLLNWDGKETEKTKWFKGIPQINEIKKLREEIRGLKGYNAKLLEDNLLIKTNIQKYIKENVGIIKEFMPAIRSLISAEAPTGGER